MPLSPGEFTFALAVQPEHARILHRLVRVRLADIAGMPTQHRAAFSEERRKLEDVCKGLSEIVRLMTVGDIDRIINDRATRQLTLTGCNCECRLEDCAVCHAVDGAFPSEVMKP